MSGKEWDPENWSGDVRKDPDEAGVLEPLNCNESSLPEEAASPPPRKEINPAFIQETIITQDTADSPQELPLLTLFSSRLITRLNSQQAPKGEVQSVTHEGKHYTPKEILIFSNL